MKRILFTLLLIPQLLTNAFAQQPAEAIMTKTYTQPADEIAFNSPYRTRTRIDAPAIAVGAGLSALGLYLIQENKKAPSADELAAIDADLEGAKMDIPKFDRFSAGWYSLDAKKISDIPFYGSFAAPLLLLFDKDISQKAGQVAVLYVETMAVTGTLFTLTVANVERNRPLVYDEDAAGDPDHERRKKHAQNSFFAGHTAACASATFFAAKVFHDFNPDSGLRPVVWGAAAAVPAAVGYLRLRAGKHFLSDNLLGYALGAGAGILIPQLHKTKGMENVSITPVMGPYNGMAATLTF